MDRQLLRDRVGRLVLGRREALGLSLRRAASPRAGEGGPNHATIGAVENGLANVTIDTLADLARFLSARWELQLVGGAEQDELRRELMDRLASILDRLDDRDVRQLLRSVAGLEAELGIERQSKQ